jgi:hypothetical protein
MSRRNSSRAITSEKVFCPFRLIAISARPIIIHASITFEWTPSPPYPEFITAVFPAMIPYTSFARTPYILTPFVQIMIMIVQILVPEVVYETFPSCRCGALYPQGI